MGVIALFELKNQGKKKRKKRREKTEEIIKNPNNIYLKINHSSKNRANFEGGFCPQKYKLSGGTLITQQARCRLAVGFLSKIAAVALTQDVRKHQATGKVQALFFLYAGPGIIPLAKKTTPSYL